MNPPIIALLLSLFSYTLPAQDSWSLQKCFTHAYENNVNLKRQALSAEVSENNLRNTRFNQLPNLNARAGHGFRYGWSIDQTTNRFEEEQFQTGSFNVNSSVSLFNGLQTRNSIRRDNFSLSFQLEEVEKLRDELTIQIATAYLQILFNKEMVHSFESQYERAQHQTERTKKLFENGKAAKSDLLEVQSQEARELVNLTQAYNDLDLSYLTLSQILDLDASVPFEIEAPDSLEIEPGTLLNNVQDVYNQALQKLHIVSSAEFNLKSKEMELKISKGQRSPELFLSSGYGTSYSSLNPNRNYSQQLYDNRSLGIDFGLSIPIFNRMNTDTRIANAKIAIDDARYYMQLQKLELYKNIQSAYLDATSSFESYKASKVALETSTNLLQFNEKKYEAGVLSAVELSLSKTDAIKRQAEFLQAKYTYLFRSKILDFYQGKPILL